MDKKILRIQRKSSKAFGLFHKIINRLLKYNEKIEVMLSTNEAKLYDKRKELEELEKVTNDSLYDAAHVINENLKQLSHLKKITGE